MPSATDLLTRWPIALRLPLQFDPARLRDDLARMESEWWTAHRGPYHDGNWEMIALRSPNGELSNQTSRGGRFGFTEAAARCDYLPEVLAAFPAELNRVRYMRLRAAGRILPHSDPMQQIDPRLLRIHIPVITSPEVDFRVRNVRIVMSAGESWFVDVRFRHEVTNGGTEDRIHLVVDLLRNDAVNSLLATAQSSGSARLTGYLLLHALPGRIRRIAGIGN